MNLSAGGPEGWEGEGGEVWWVGPKGWAPNTVARVGGGGEQLAYAGGPWVPIWLAWGGPLGSLVTTSPLSDGRDLYAGSQEMLSFNILG